MNYIIYQEHLKLPTDPISKDDHLVTLFFTENTWHEEGTCCDRPQALAVLEFRGTNPTADAVLSALERALAAWVTACDEGTQLIKRSRGTFDLWWIEPELSDANSSLQPFLKTEGITRVTKLLWVDQTVFIPWDQELLNTEDVEDSD